MKAKKMFLLAALMLAAFTTASAQEEKVEFQPHWYLQLQGGAAHTLGEAKFMDLVNPAAQVAIGYPFNPVLGLRLQGSGYQSKGGWRGFPDCRMNTNSYPSFCPVCREAIRYMVDFYTKEIAD